MDNIALYIDADNINSEHFPNIYKEIKKKGRLIIKCVYGDWTSKKMDKWKNKTTEFGLEPKTAFNLPGKNSSDMLLTVDIMEDIYTKPHINTFIILSCDSDYIPVIKKVRAKGNRVICIGYLKSTSPSLVKSCDEFISIDTLIKHKVKSKHSDKKIELKNLIVSILDNGSDIDLGNLKLVILNEDPSFDYRNYGVSSMTKLINLYPKTFGLYKEKNTSYVYLK